MGPGISTEGGPEGRCGQRWMWRGKGGARATPSGSGVQAERSWATGNDLKGAGNRAGCLVLNKVSKNLPLLISTAAQTSCTPSALPAESR